MKKKASCNTEGVLLISLELGQHRIVRCGKRVWCITCNYKGSLPGLPLRCVEQEASKQQEMAHMQASYDDLVKERNCNKDAKLAGLSQDAAARKLLAQVYAQALPEQSPDNLGTGGGNTSGTAPFWIRHLHPSQDLWFGGGLVWCKSCGCLSSGQGSLIYISNAKGNAYRLARKIKQTTTWKIASLL